MRCVAHWCGTIKRNACPSKAKDWRVWAEFVNKNYTRSYFYSTYGCFSIGLEVVCVRNFVSILTVQTLWIFGRKGHWNLLKTWDGIISAEPKARAIMESRVLWFTCNLTTSNFLKIFMPIAGSSVPTYYFTKDVLNLEKK